MRRILVLDDNRDLAENLAEIIADRGDEAVIAGDEHRALALVAERRFDVLVSDLRMPRMSGAHVLREVRRIDPGLPAIVVTALGEADGLGAAEREGLFALLPKPVPIARLLALLGAARRNGLVALALDDAALRDTLREALRDRGFASVEASSLLELSPPVTPFAAIVDARREDAAGSEARPFARHFPTLPLLVLTADPGRPPPWPHQALFAKPLSVSQVAETLDRLYEVQGLG
jgi:DNA-binding NtrC family response regulator